MTKKLPLIVVLGATACGKSKLAIELAKRFHGEIISADSMQVYRGLDIVTNKVTYEEQQQAEHHMINIVNPTSRYSVIDFRDKSLQIINELLEGQKLPIVVGGTHYYIESLIWKCFTHEIRDDIRHKFGNVPDSSNKNGSASEPETLFDKESHLMNELDKSVLHCEDDLESIEKFFSKKILSLGLKHIPANKLWNILEQVDPNTAHVFHPNDKRRVIRSLQLIQQNRKQYSKLMDEQNISSNGSNQFSLGGPLRFHKTCIIWLNADEETLNKILDERVDQMLERGLVAELEKFHEDFNKQRISDGTEVDYDKGIFQTIGFKEFHDYLIMDEETKASPKGNKLLSQSIKNMKCSTRRYARHQLRWIRRRFLRSGSRDLPPVYKFDVNFDNECWLNEVQKPAFDIVESILNDTTISDDLKAFQAEPCEQEQGRFEPGKFYCEICDRTIIGKINIDIHLKSRIHERRRLYHGRKKAKLETECEHPLETEKELSDTVS